MRQYYLQNGIESEPLFDPNILKALDFSKSKVIFDPPISVIDPGENLKVRPLCSGDYDRGYLKLLSFLTKVGDISRKQFLDRFHAMSSCKGMHYITVIEDTVSGQIIGSATLAVEQKFIHDAGFRGRLEDVVVSDEYRGRQLGKLLVETIRLLAEHVGCYKITLDCRDRMVKFYKQLGFQLEEGNSNFMTVRFQD
ncbi:probable glucosamine 6-phosphate N-acetyltransferase isoform X1 [Limulus polyphemus]|uniref:Glucosamine 6-phosphate N-acetyltransferase n=1 Tax=Limulus polyphemus TaxID=6850 RepID=A0ABM1T2A2_LIMPO|nr:probable glucosamine 6-phosphate N-acetyltransferase isoform X1 [Limulus polyphemus]